MGIYDRDYYRKEGPSYLESLIPSGQVCKWLIGINILIFVLQLITKPSPPSPEDFLRAVMEQQTKKAASDQGARGGNDLDAPRHPMLSWVTAGSGPVTDALILDTHKVAEGQVWRLLTAAFLHSTSNLWHIVFNMLFLWMFGSELEKLYGSKEFLSFYLVAAVVASLAFEVQALVQGSPMIALGASGAVTAILVLYAFHFPTQTILLFFLLPVPIWAFVIFQVAQDAFNLIGGAHTGVGVSAHLGGAAFGALYYLNRWRITSLWPGWQWWRRARAKPNLRVYRPEDDVPIPVASGVGADVDEHLDAKLDAVLEKLSRHGRESLTEVEREILLRASQVYKKKRT